MATGKSVEGDTLIAKAGGGNGKSRRGRPNSQKSHKPTADMEEALEVVGGLPRGKSGKGGGGGGGGNEGGGGTTSKRPQYCTICKNHNKRVLKKRHKCPYSDCQCPLCQLSRSVQLIMCHQQRLWRFRKSAEKNGSSSQGESDVSTTPNSSSASPSSSSCSSTSTFQSDRDNQLHESLLDDPVGGSDLTSAKDRLKFERSGKQQVCDKCRNHSVWVLKRGHKGKCPYEHCDCQYCSFTIKRRDLMKHQQRVRRAQVTTNPTTGSQDTVPQPARTSDSTPTPDEVPAISPDEDFSTNDQETNNTQNTSADAQETWHGCSNDKPEDLRVYSKLSHQANIESPPCHPPTGDEDFFHSAGDSRLVQHPQAISMPIQQVNMDAMAFQQEPSRESTPFQPSQDLPIAYRPQSSDSFIFDQQNRESEPLQSPVSHQMSFSESIKDSTTFHQSGSNTSQFQQPVGNQTPFHQSNAESMTFQQQIVDSKPFQQLNTEPMSFQIPNRQSTPIQQLFTDTTSFQQPSQDPTQFQQPNRNPTPFQQPYQQPTRNVASFQQSTAESTAFHQHSQDSSIPFQQLNREYVSFQNERDLSPLQESSRNSIVYQHPYRDTNIPFQQPNGNLTPFQQQAIPVEVDEQMHFPLKRMKIEPNVENDSIYDCDRIQSHYKTFQTPDGNENFKSYDMPTSHPKSKFGVQPEDMVLRKWPANEKQVENFQLQSGRNIRDSSVCGPLTNNLQPFSLLHTQMQMPSQLPRQHLSGNAPEADYKPGVSIVGSWDSTNVSMSTLNAPRLTTNIAHTRCSAVHLNDSDEFISSTAIQGQGAWWHQVRIAGLERTNSC